jgi:competence protein ComEA
VRAGVNGRLRYHRGVVIGGRELSLGAVLALVGAIVWAQGPAVKDSSLPEGIGKAALLKVCNDCHGAEAAVGQLKTRDEWSKTLDEMAGNGAQASDEEWTQILEYLEKHFSLIFVNTADAKALANVFDVPEDEGQAIVGYRDAHGRFGTIDDLKHVPGLEPAKIDARKDRFVF